MCWKKVEHQLGGLDTATTASADPPKRTKASPYQRRRYEPKNFDWRGELYRMFGVDLTNVPGISAITAQTILCEIGTDVSRFRALNVKLSAVSPNFRVPRKSLGPEQSTA